MLVVVVRDVKETLGVFGPYSSMEEARGAGAAELRRLVEEEGDDSFAYDVVPLSILTPSGPRLDIPAIGQRYEHVDGGGFTIVGESFRLSADGEVERELSIATDRSKGAPATVPFSRIAELGDEWVLRRP